jgi:coenzyme PQQ precursor peptide PqqA
MVAALVFGARSGDDSLRDVERSPCGPSGLRATSTRRTFMQWTTPTACDLRFGFEITMYVASR